MCNMRIACNSYYGYGLISKLVYQIGYGSIDDLWNSCKRYSSSFKNPSKSSIRIQKAFPQWLNLVWMTHKWRKLFSSMTHEWCEEVGELLRKLCLAFSVNLIHTRMCVEWMVTSYRRISFLRQGGKLKKFAEGWQVMKILTSLNTPKLEGELKVHSPFWNYCTNMRRKERVKIFCSPYKVLRFKSSTNFSTRSFCRTYSILCFQAVDIS